MSVGKKMILCPTSQSQNLHYSKENSCFFPLFLSRDDNQRMGSESCKRKLSQSFREVYYLAIVVTSKRWFKKTHQCPLPGVPPDPGRHHHLLHHAAHGDGLEDHSRGEWIVFTGILFSIIGT